MENKVVYVSPMIKTIMVNAQRCILQGSKEFAMEDGQLESFGEGSNVFSE